MSFKKAFRKVFQAWKTFLNVRMILNIGEKNNIYWIFFLFLCNNINMKCYLGCYYYWLWLNLKWIPLNLKIDLMFLKLFLIKCIESVHFFSFWYLLINQNKFILKVCLDLLNPWCFDNFSKPANVSSFFGI